LIAKNVAPAKNAVMLPLNPRNADAMKRPSKFHPATFFAINSVNSEMRSTRLGIQEFLNGIAYAIANIMVGYWVKSSGFLQQFD
jgi:hypothetical protein